MTVPAKMHLRTCGILLAMWAGGVAEWCPAQDSAAGEALKKLYGFETWVGRTKTNYAHSITGWEPDFGPIGATNVIARRLGRAEPITQYSFNLATNPGVKLQLRVRECASVSDAHRAIIAYFVNSAAVQPFPLGANLGVDIGDRCYVNPPRSFVVFARNNVFVILDLVHGDYSVAGVAEQLDNQLKEHKP
jgi:hypothetical protein